MDCLPNTGIDLIPFLVMGLLVLGVGIFLTVRARKSRAGWMALVAIPLILGVGIAVQPAAPASAAQVNGCAPGTSTPAPEPTPTPTATPVGCQQQNDKSVARDTDADGIQDACDLDTDNDGIPDSIEDHDSNGLFEDDDIEGVFGPIAVLGDGVPSYRDLDSDNDSVLDLHESGIPFAVLAQIDVDRDGIIDAGVAVGANGLADVLESAPDSGVLNYDLANTDKDDRPDFVDLSSDGVNYDLHSVGNDTHDGFGMGFIAVASDPDGDGIMDVVDSNTAVRGSPGAPLPPWF